MKKLALVFALSVIALSGCSNSSGLDAKTATSGFDGGRVVSIPPHGNACSTMTCTGLGAQWNSNNPDKAFLLVNVFNDIQGITGAELNIDGKVYNLGSPTQFTNFDNVGPGISNSEQPFVVKLSMIRDIVNSKRTWLRVHTTKGDLEDAVIDNGKDSKSYYALKRFLSEVDKN